MDALGEVVVLVLDAGAAQLAALPLLPEHHPSRLRSPPNGGRE
jgi:hypothetical protein